MSAVCRLGVVARSGGDGGSRANQIVSHGASNSNTGGRACGARFEGGGVGVAVRSVCRAWSFRSVGSDASQGLSSGEEIRLMQCGRK